VPHSLQNAKLQHIRAMEPLAKVELMLLNQSNTLADFNIPKNGRFLSADLDMNLFNDANLPASR
jgi:hypothetical protein